MLQHQIKTLDTKIQIKANELNSPKLSPQERLTKTRELIDLFKEQNKLLKQIFTKP